MDKNICEIVLEALNDVKSDSGTSVYDHKDLNKTLEELGISSIDFIKFILLLEEKLNFEMPDELLLFLGSNAAQKIVETIEKFDGGIS